MGNVFLGFLDESGIVFISTSLTDVPMDGTMEFDDFFASCHLMEPIDVLGDDIFQSSCLFQFGKIFMGGIGFGIKVDHPILIETIELSCILIEEMMGDDLFGVILVFLMIESVLASEIRYSGFRGDSGPSEKDDIVTG